MSDANPARRFFLCVGLRIKTARLRTADGPFSYSLFSLEMVISSREIVISSREMVISSLLLAS